MPASRLARMSAKLLAEWTSRPFKSCRSERTSPGVTGTEVAPSSSSSPASFTSFTFMVTPGPWAVGARGWSCNTRKAVMSLVRLAMGTGVSGPDWTRSPRPGTATAACPVVGQGRTGEAPGAGSPVRVMAGRTTGVGTLRVSW